jgi:hypothetical protein
VELYQPDLLYGCIDKVLQDPDKKELSRRFVSTLDPSSHALVVTELASFLLGMSPESVEHIEDNGPLATSLQSRLFTVTVGGKKRTYFFRIKDSASACTLPLAGVLLALLTPKLSTAVQAGTVLKTLWSNIISLQYDEDRNAIEVLTAISAIRTSRFAGFPHDKIVGMEFPSTDEIATCIPSISRDQVTAGIKRLESLHLIECKYWGDQAGDLAHKDNRWGERL